MNLNRRTFIGTAATWIVVAPVAVKAQTNVSPSGTTVPPAASITDGNGGVWTLGTTKPYGRQVLLNGKWVAGGQATQISWQNNQIKVQNSLGDWWLWTGNDWASTTAPGVTPPPPPPPSSGTLVLAPDGGNNVALGSWSAAGGLGSTTGTGANGAFSFGQGAQALGGGAVAFGRGSLAAYTDTFVFGQGCQAHSDNGRAAGWACLSAGDQGYAHGYQANDREIDGLEAYAHGSFLSNKTGNFELFGVGDAQMGRTVLRVLTNNATTTPLTTDGGGPGFYNQIRLPDRASYVLQWLVIARDISNGDSRSWKIVAMATRGVGAGSTTVFAPVITNIANSTGAMGWNVALTVDTYNGAVQLNVIGQAGKSIQWVAAMIDGENVG